MIYSLNNLPNKYYVKLHRLINHLIVSRVDALTIDAICEKLNYGLKKLKSKPHDYSREYEPYNPSNDFGQDHFLAKESIKT